MQQVTDPYRALGVSRAATEAEIKAAHRKLVKRFHPDTGTQSETQRFLRVQEAYRVLSDPLLRREWDLKHAQGPVRADQSPAGTTTRRRRPPAPKPTSEPAETPPPPRATADDRPNAQADPRTQPRSSRAYTWSASEVPWWEEGRADKKQPTDAAAAGDAADGADAKGGRRAKPDPDGEPGSPDGPVFGQQDFDVYNRSSGAAWSMAARAYFRKGEAELPRRGSFRRQGTTVVTAGRARSAADAEARHHAAADAEAHRRAAAQADARHRAAAAAAAASGGGAQATYAHAGPPPRPGMGTTHIVRRALRAPWPSIGMRFGLALVAWLPIAAITAVLTADTFDQPVAALFIGAALVLLLALPRAAYIAALATLLALAIGAIFVGGVFLAGASVSLDRLSVYVGGLLVVGYLATAAVIVVGPSTLRPWSAER